MYGSLTQKHSWTFDDVILSHPAVLRQDLSEFWNLCPTVSWYITVGKIKLTSTPDLHTNFYISGTVLHYSYYAWVTCAHTSLFFLPSRPSSLIRLLPTHWLWAWHKLYVYLWKVKEAHLRFLDLKKTWKYWKSGCARKQQQIRQGQFNSCDFAYRWSLITRRKIIGNR